ncbi:hypothetical protein [Rhodoferax mekongensis]|uniref:DUF1080 domain-containing protein n=1 Tax=Rhodoferax mekongensis TaxID=3068341 RepID=A0ABZ0AWJ9_9BURK|nr:hypothetical protein [Rhodoferax sp. TBRC 17307]WNO03986.1 hypothetical protein RAN89_13850 [Rhodoferax sp. TBRC 17307]
MPHFNKIFAIALTIVLFGCSSSVPVGDNFYPKTFNGYLGHPPEVLNRLAGKWTLQKLEDGKYVDVTAKAGLRVSEETVGLTRTITVDIQNQGIVEFPMRLTLNDNAGVFVCIGCAKTPEAWFGRLLN